MKSVATRVKECIELRSKLQQLGIDNFPELQPFVSDMNEYVRDGDRRVGLIPLPALGGKKFKYALENVEGVESIITITK